MAQTVFVGLSGGVDSSLTAALLLEQGYNVRGVHMKNWALDLPNWECPWEDDYADASKVADQLDIELDLYDFQDEYKDKVVDYLIEGYKSGQTPNPDIMCNQEIKFKLFLETCLSSGTDMIATGHYARTKDGKLYKAANPNKDQTYFLARVTENALHQTLFPLGGFASKSEVRAEAKKRGLITSGKKDSVGICFVGKVGIREFLSEFVETQAGAIIDQHGKIIGQHDGAIFYTIGQRQGLGVGGGLPYYVTDKSMDKNEVYVTTDPSDANLWSHEIIGVQAHWINEQPDTEKTYSARTRHLGELADCNLEKLSETSYKISLAKYRRALDPGQSAVIYYGDQCLGAMTIS